MADVRGRAAQRAHDEANRDEDGTTAPRVEATEPAAVLRLQRSVGNRAVTAALARQRVAAEPTARPLVLARSAGAARRLQRMPTRATLEKQLGKPSKLPTESRKYKALLKALDKYHDGLRQRYDPARFQPQFINLAARLEAVKAAAQAYHGFTSTKAVYMTGTLTQELAKEEALLTTTLARVVTSPPPIGLTQTLGNLLLLHIGPQHGAPVQLQDRDKLANQRGGSSEVTEYRTGSTSAFFKPGKSTLETRPDDAILADLKQRGLTGDKLVQELNALQNERLLAVEAVGIDAADARMGNRDEAMFRLSRLLGEDVIARARKAVAADGTTGSLMDKAQGESGARLMAKDKMAKDATELATKGAGAVNQRDPDLMRLMSKLQVIDLLAYQIDRNPANYWIQQDARTGEVTGITGIDNDLALGTKDLAVDTKGTLKRAQELPGFSRYVDRELAERVLALDLKLLPLVFRDLLSPAEIAALTRRFERLRGLLAEKSTKLLGPKEWDDAVAKGLLQENRSYWADIEYNKSKYGPQQ